MGATLWDSEDLNSNPDPASQLSEVGEMMSLIRAVVWFLQNGHMIQASASVVGIN